ncbi:MAG: hypothetical protein ISR59_12250 [Anaerolineales bacterium]|uniref:Uncharacterized protein n=1 Tax=Candidatus Desulfolinea nitratireducens TaxID=2841698 RepID=A0A8J6NI32_9CHLR|nr:hypothetical protein [Candidatus Desulfolinea nitratireducens]MBL6961869.1 hypothetical protein [Anaerolineales bacterium]
MIIQKSLILLTINLLLVLSSCKPVTIESTPDQSYLEEELAAEAFATASSKEVQIAAKDLPYAEISRDGQAYLAFWFIWNEETVFIPVAHNKSEDIRFIICQVGPDPEIEIGKLFSGYKFIQDECVDDDKTLENASPIIKIPGYFDDGIMIYDGNELDGADWNVIDLNGEYAENLADAINFVIKNDLTGSGDLVISIYRKDGPSGDLYSDDDNPPTFTLPVERLQISFTKDLLADLEYVDDLLYALEREFTWNISAGYPELKLGPGDENWFVLTIDEVGGQFSKANIQIKGVGNK